MIIAIDGPSSAGKSTLGRMLARELAFLYLNTGAMYRAVALAVIEAGLDVTDPGVVTLAEQADIVLAGDPDSMQVMLNGRDVSELITSESVSHMASMVSTIPGVRRALVARQRIMGEQAHGAVLDGRDIGTVVFPRAEVKFFLVAGAEERARRRYEEDLLKDRDVTYEETLADLQRRDERDTTREDSPLVSAPDAIKVDSTGLSIPEVLEKMLAIVRSKLASRTA
ncbi:MAG: (d)CMP kinase [Pyrinomonadaceae bacterium]